MQKSKLYLLVSLVAVLGLVAAALAVVDPHNAQHLVVGANTWNTSGQFEVYAYTSFNGGKTWTSSQPYVSRNASRLNAADATVAFGSDGTVYFGFVAFNPAAGAVAV